MNRLRASRRCGLVGGAITFVLASAMALGAQSSKPLDYELKAVYLLNFGRFVTWPAASPGPPELPLDATAFTVCVIGTDPFGPALDAAIAGEVIDGKGILAKRITSSQDARGCRILFVSASEDKQLLAILQAVNKTAGVLTVSDMPRFADRGGIIQFVSDKNRVRFEINATAAERAGLSLSSELLRVALKISGKPGA